MCTDQDRQDADLDPKKLILLVVGAHLRAEVADRPLGDRLRQRILHWQAENPSGELLVPLICTDLWYLNAQDLLLRPTISIGPPEVNAASAYFANRLPTAFVIDQTLQVQLDPEFVTLQACIWGVDRRATAAGLDIFVDRYLVEFLSSAHAV